MVLYGFPMVNRLFLFQDSFPVSPFRPRGLRGTPEAAAVGGRGGALGGRSAGAAAQAGAAADGAGGEWEWGLSENVGNIPNEIAI